MKRHQGVFIQAAILLNFSLIFLSVPVSLGHIPQFSPNTDETIVVTSTVGLDDQLWSSAVTQNGVLSPDAPPGPVSGNQPWAFVLCRFPGINRGLPDAAFYQEIIRRVTAYWQEVSYNQITLSGSQAFGWYTLPQTQAYYYQAGLDKLANDCLAVANADIYYPAFFGMNLLFNDDVAPSQFAYGTYRVLNLDGVNKTYGVTWLPHEEWNTLLSLTTVGGLRTVNHEMGHAFGLPHSSGQYGLIYDDLWDLMGSSPGMDGSHMISYHKDMLGWIPSNRKAVVTPGSLATLTLEELALPPANNFLMVKIPLGGTTNHFYTLEARRRVGYDQDLMGDAVIIHDVVTDRQPVPPATQSPPAQIIDGDHNGIAWDAGPMWTPGEVFTDTTNGITVCIDRATATGFVVTVGSGLPVTCALQADLTPTEVRVSTAHPRVSQTVSFSIRLNNLGAAATGTIVTTTIPNNMTYVPGSATTTQGTVSSSGPLIFNTGTISYSVPVTLTFSAVVDAGILTPTVLNGPVMISWSKGSLSRSFTLIANGLPVYLPLIQR